MIHRCFISRSIPNPVRAFKTYVRPLLEYAPQIWLPHQSYLLMGRQVNKLCQVCYFHLRRLRTVRRSLTKESLLTLVHAFITSRIDHCNGVLYGSNGYLLDRLQSVLNSAARLVLGVPKFDSVSAAIRNELHWLPIGKRIQFKIALIVRHCIFGAAPEYLTELCRPVSLSSVRHAESALCFAW